jgi:ribosomal-protein-alanine N-acetyltransferase
VLTVSSGGIVGYFVAMPGVDEMHLLNLTVAPPWQRQGLARRLLDSLEERCRDAALSMLWLEVRASNERARLLYRRRGFSEVGLRRGYYPAPQGMREDAVVMSTPVPAEDGDGLD